MVLEEKLAEMRSESAGKFPDDTKKKFRRQIVELRNSGIMDTALKVGGKMPSFSLPNVSGETISSSDLLKSGNLVVTFYRGVW